MQKNDLLKKDNEIIRILKTEDKVLVIDCIKMTMPKWIESQELEGYEVCNEEGLFTYHQIEFVEEKESTPEQIKIMYQRYTMIAGILSFIDDDIKRNEAITFAACEYKISKQTLRKYLCRYLTFQDKRILQPCKKDDANELTNDEKNMRWALNKFFYNQQRNTLNTAYSMMLKERYCSSNGLLYENYPTFYQFRYFYRKTRKLQNYYISRDGLKKYQRNKRPCVSEGVRVYAPAPGTGMMDSTICDIYLVNESGQLVGRPILTACVDAYSSICYGYSLTWEGGVYSLRNMLINIVSDKVRHCKSFGIHIAKDVWPVKVLPGKMITDQGSEYKGDTFAQISELGITVVNLPSYRPDLKGPIEKFFDIIQNSYKPFLRGKGLIEPDFQERGAHDYRKDACLTMEEFEKIILRCIIYYNSQHVLKDYPYTKEMLEAEVQPYASSIWDWGIKQNGCNLIQIKRDELVLCLLPRTIGKFSRFGLTVNKLRYHNDKFTEDYLKGGDTPVAYNPDDITSVWLYRDGRYSKFELIEIRFSGDRLDTVIKQKRKQKAIISGVKKEMLQSEINLGNHIKTLTENSLRREKINIKEIRNTRRKEQTKEHIDFMKEVGLNE
ncbi:MAG: Mu transposase C-terminal domain-containing protein [Sulfurospirillaceae bacterium]|nr:Mu transposase C-terminal domain-containing protein [Sulfurospirillaceae bacterium]